MTTIKIYKHTNGWYVFGSQIPPVGSITLQRDNENRLKFINTASGEVKIEWLLITSILKENGTAYSSYADFMSAMGGFFAAENGDAPVNVVTANAGVNLNTSALNLEATQLLTKTAIVGIQTTNASLDDKFGEKAASPTQYTLLDRLKTIATDIVGILGTGSKTLTDLYNVFTTSLTIGSSVLPTGAATQTTLSERLSENDFDTKIGGLTEPAPATDTASSGVNGRLQRIAQRISSLITAVGSPFQVGGLIGNTSFAATQTTPANLKTEAHLFDSSTNGLSSTGNALDIHIKTGFPTDYATNTKQSDGSQQTKLTDGTNIAKVSNANTAANVADKALVVNVSPNTPVNVKFIDQNGEAQPLKFNAEVPQFCSQDYLQALAEGDIAGHGPFVKYGRLAGVTNNATASALTPFTLNADYQFPAVAAVMHVVSSNAADKGTATAGTGVRTLRIYGLTAGYVEDTEDVILNGTGVVNTAKSWLRINKVSALTAGSSGKAVGTITIKDSGDTITYASIEVGLTQTRQLVYTVPTGKTLYIVYSNISSGVGGSQNSVNQITFTLKSNSLEDGTLNSLMIPKYETSSIQRGVITDFKIPIKIPATADLAMYVLGDTNTACLCFATLRGWIE